MLLDVFHHARQDDWRNHRVHSKDWVFEELQVRLDVRQVVLLHVGEGRLAQHHGHVLVWCVALLWGRHVNHQLVNAGNLDLL